MFRNENSPSMQHLLFAIHDYSTTQRDGIHENLPHSRMFEQRDK